MVYYFSYFSYGEVETEGKDVTHRIDRFSVGIPQMGLVGLVFGTNLIMRLLVTFRLDL